MHMTKLMYTWKRNKEQKRSIPVLIASGPERGEKKKREKRKRKAWQVQGFEKLSIFLTKHLTEHGKDSLLFHTAMTVSENNEMITKTLHIIIQWDIIWDI